MTASLIVCQSQSSSLAIDDTDHPSLPTARVANLEALSVRLSLRAAMRVSESPHEGALQFLSLHTYLRLCQISLTGRPKLGNSISSTSELALE